MKKRSVLDILFIINLFIIGFHSVDAQENLINKRLIQESIRYHTQQKKLNSSGEIVREITVQNIVRSYSLYTPRLYNSNKPMPIVLGFHGGTTTPQKFARTTGFNNVAEEKGFMIAYPQGINKNWNDGRNAKGLPTQDDVSFVKAIIEDLHKIRNIDTHRIYAVGISNGGFLTQRLACQLSDKIVAFASVASTLAEPLQYACQTKRPVSIMMINSPEDKIVPWKGGLMTKGKGGVILSVPSTISFWLNKNHCNSKLQIQKIGENKPNDGTSIEVSRYHQKCDNSEVILVKINGGGHTWPDGSGQPKWLVGRTSRKINGSRFIWNFFERHALSTKKSMGLVQ
jgi:polyhydroxybutyrate depolymerase